MARTSRGRRTTGSIRRLPSGRYQARVRGDDGMLAPAPDTFATKVDADRWLASMITDRAQGRWVDPRAGHVTLGAFADEWVRGKVGLAPKTCELYDYLLNHLILPALGDVELIDLTPSRVRTWRAELLRADRPGPTTIAKAYRLLSAMMVTAAIDNRIARNPCVEKGAGVERSPEMRMATPDQVAAIASAINPRYRAMVLTAAYAGCRFGELTGLRQRNLDLDEATLVISEQVVELRGGRLLVRQPKSDAGRRVVHLPAGLVAELRTHLAEFVLPDPEGLVFTSDRGTPLRQSNFRDRHWYPAVRSAGVQKLRFHDLRHVAGTLATVSGATIREVQARLGHASPAAAYRYQHVLESRDAEIAERLNVIFRAEPPATA
ncbi:MAG TPA: tyrosine-type recombinase/integrase [Acidimicrobiales bacterium]|nr:tyrosine-type recombinase/integrase [Acidimicrobiales bacterium]